MTDLKKILQVGNHKRQPIRDQIDEPMSPLKN